MAGGRTINKSETARLHAKYRSTTHYVISSLIPYTESNLKLSFRPNAFFNDLEKLSDHKHSKEAVRMSYYRALKRGLIEVGDDSRPRLTDVGVKQLKRYEPQKLCGEASVLVIFDIPERERELRRQLRTLLRELKFEQIQQSVWRSEYDVMEYLVPEIRDNGLDRYVQVHEAARIV